LAALSRFENTTEHGAEEVNMRMEELKDKPVMSIDTATKLGAVQDLLLDDSYLQIAAVEIGGRGLFGGHKQAVAYSAIRGIGPDAVMVSGQDAVQEVGNSDRLGPTHALNEMQQQVLSESGVDLGRIVDLGFEPQTGAITGLGFAMRGTGESESGDIYDVAREDIISITEKMVIVRHSVVEQIADESVPAQVQGVGQVVRHEGVSPPDGEPNGSESAAAGFQPATTITQT
jgi:uncharacterized protein YrrD